MDKPVNPLHCKGFPTCPYYAIRALLCRPAAETEGADETDPGMARTQRHLDHGEHLRPSGFAVETTQRRHDGKGAGTAGGTAAKQVVRHTSAIKKIAASDKTLAAILAEQQGFEPWRCC